MNLNDTLADKLNPVITKYLSQFTQAWGEGDYNDALNKLQMVHELVKGCLIISQLVREDI